MALAHHNLVVWQRADDLFIEVHHLTHECFPPSETYELGRQIRRAAFSVPANVVEGIARKGEAESINFFNYASASLAELGYGLHAACRLEYIDHARLADLEQKIRRIAAPLRGLIRRYRAQGAIVQTLPVMIAILAATAVVR